MDETGTASNSSVEPARAGRLRLHGRPRWTKVTAVAVAGVLLLEGCAATPAALSTPPSATTTRSAPPGGRGTGGGSNARSSNDEGGSTGTVSAVSSNTFTLSTSTGVKVTVNETSSTTYTKGTSPASASAVTTGEPVLVLGTVNSQTITADQVTVQPPATGSSADAAQVVPFQQGAPSSAKQVGQIPANYSEGSGTIMTGATADKAAQAALADYPGGIVDRVVQLSGGEYEVHYIGVNWPHHVFVSEQFQVEGAN